MSRTLRSLSVCFWNSTTTNKFINGEYIMVGTHRNLPYYGMTLHTNCPPGGSNLYLYFDDDINSGWYVDNNVGQENYYSATCQIGPTNNDPTTTGACNNSWKLSDEGALAVVDTNVKVTNGSCPQWNCDSITTSFLNNNLCNTTFNETLGINQWRGWNSINNQWVYFYFHYQDFAYVCADSYNLQCDAIVNSGTYDYSYGWVDLSKGESTILQFENSSPQTIYCLDTDTSAPTIHPTTSIPTTSMPTTSMPTTSIPTTIMPSTLMPATTVPTTYTPTTVNPTTSSPTITPTFSPDGTPVQETTRMEVSTTNLVLQDGKDSSVVILYVCGVVFLLIAIGVVVFVVIMTMKRKRNTTNDLAETSKTTIEMSSDMIKNNDKIDVQTSDFIDRELENISMQKIINTPKSDSDINCGNGTDFIDTQLQNVGITKTTSLEGMDMNTQMIKIGSLSENDMSDSDDLYKKKNIDDNIATTLGSTIGNDQTIITPKEI